VSVATHTGTSQFLRYVNDNDNDNGKGKGIELSMVFFFFATSIHTQTTIDSCLIGRCIHQTSRRRRRRSFGSGVVRQQQLHHVPGSS
jgi:hypothetical protein